jgi:fatty-acyl-CoA synthase
MLGAFRPSRTSILFTVAVSNMIGNIRETLQAYTLERYETEFADRHLLHGIIAKWAKETPDRIAIIDFDSDREFTYRQLDDVTTALAIKLLEAGYQPGDFLATMLPLLPEHIFLEYACFKIGVIHAPLDLRLKAPEVVRSLKLINARGFAHLGQMAAADFREVAKVVQSQCPFVKHLIQFSNSEETIPGATSFTDFCAEAQTLAADSESEWCVNFRKISREIKPTDGAQVIYTTGSTGLPKPALLSHRNITAQNMCLAAGFGLFDSPTMLVNLPPSHVGCQGEQLMTTFFTGQTAVILHVFDAEKTLKAIQKHKIDCFGQIPAMFNMQYRLPNFSDYDLSSVGRVLYGGQQVSHEFIRQLYENFPAVGTGLGLSEMAGFVTYTGMTDRIEQLSDTVGWWAPITPLTIRKPMNDDGSAGEELPAGEAGEICFSGPQVLIDYVNNPEAYRKTVSTDGICYTGDLGYVTERGLVFAGRSKLVIKPKGYQVHPAQIESHFTELNRQVAACGAVGAPHNVFVEGVVLFIELKPNAELPRMQLETHAKGIAGYMRPSHYVLLEPGSFPLNRVAKTDYVRLSELARQEVETLRNAGGWDSDPSSAS